MKSLNISIMLTAILAFAGSVDAQKLLPVYQPQARFAFPNRAGGYMHYQNWDAASQGAHNLFSGQVYYSRGTNQLAMHANQQTYIVDGETYVGLSYSKTLPLSDAPLTDFVYLGAEAGYRMFEENMPSLTRVNTFVQEAMPMNYSSLTTTFYTGIVLKNRFFASAALHDLWQKTYGHQQEAFSAMRLFGVAGYYFQLPEGFALTPWVALHYPLNKAFQPAFIHAGLEIAYERDGWDLGVIPVYVPDYKAGFLLSLNPASWKLGMYFGMYYYSHSPYQEMASTISYQAP